jgi:hypothetical protein
MRLNKWNLLYSISHDGVSMITFYDMVKRYPGTIIVIQDSQGNVFGAYASAPWKKGKYFYGTGESFLFSFYVP